ncbi:glycosyltransferase [Brotaphodocola sp.]|uniref:glycosyltransferase n=1 Tax=Brotaphodocola sp. TaxID=3073577 RepID=UPI003D7E9830
MKRICVYGCSAMFGGTEQYLLTMYKGIDRNKIQFDFLFPHNMKNISYSAEIEKLGGRIYREYYYQREEKLPDAMTIEKVLQKHPEWDGVYVNWQSVDTAYRLLIAAKKCGLPYRIIHAHNNNYNRPFKVKDKIYELYFHMTKRYYLTHELACSTLAGDWLFHNKNYTVIPNAVEFEKFSFSNQVRERIRTKYGLRENQLVIGFCGRLVEQKNPEFLLEIFEQLYYKNSETVLLIVGDGILRKKMEEKIKEKCLKNIIFTGSVSDVENYMQAMDCFLLPSRFEGFGIVLLEAQAAGLPCFTSKNVVPEETNLTGNVHFISLEKGPKVWADELLSTSLERYNAMELLLKSDYTVDKAVKKIMKIFNC